MPRRYRMGQRATEMQATRDRIVEAAIDLSIEVGISNISMRQVGLRADVAPGTLRNHFAAKRSLEDAMVERLTAEAPLPEATIFDGAETIGERLDRFICAAGTFFDQAAPLYRMWMREPMLTSPWSEAGSAYGARWAELQRLALGPVAGDDDVRAVIRAILDISVFDRVRAGTRTTGEACALLAAAITPWIESRSRRPGGAGDDNALRSA